MSDSGMIRLNKVLRELNLSLDIAIKYLQTKNIKIEARPTTKINQEIYNILKQEFSNKRNQKQIGKIDLSRFKKPVRDKITNDKKDGDIKRKRRIISKDVKMGISESPVISINKDIWSKYILAQEKILKFKSLPIAIFPEESPIISDNILRLKVDQEIFKKIFREEVEKVFKLKNYDFTNDNILQDLEITEQISLDSLTSLKESAESKYIEFNEHPIIEGSVKAKRENHIDLKDIIGELPKNHLFNKDGLLLLTTNQRELASGIEDVSFDKLAGAVYPVYPTISFLLSVICTKSCKQESASRFVVFDGQLHNQHEINLHQGINLRRKNHYLNFQFPENFGIEKKVRELEKTRGVVLPAPTNNSLQFRIEINGEEKYEDDNIRVISPKEQNSDFQREVKRIKKAIEKYLGKPLLKITYNTEYSFDPRKLKLFYSQSAYLEDRFWDKMYSDVHGNEFQISRNKETISFDFDSFEDLNIKKETLSSYDYFNLEDYQKDHRYKYKIKFETGLHELQQKLNLEAPSLVTKLISNGQQLKFYRHYKSGNKAFVRDHLTNVIHENINSEFFKVKIHDTFQEKYLCVENFDLKVELEEEKLSKLKRESFYFGSKKSKKLLGRLQKVDYPYLDFFVDDETIIEVQENIANNVLHAIFPDLKGETDKIIRLTNTVQKLNAETILPNNNAKEFLFDSSTAKPIDNIEYLLEPSGDSWRAFEENTLSNYLNTSQKEAIFKSLYSEELMLIQGPPGTGKSTAIAEIIWHHLLRDPKERILLTSETNLAVDNAMDRIKTDHNNIVKPIRFGNDERLASEGLFYSYPTIQSFRDNMEFVEPNAVSHWITNISNRVTSDKNENVNNALEQWKSHLLKMEKVERELFSDKYVEHTNLIGATGSSMGKLNSEGKYTSFFHSYLKIFEQEKYFSEYNRKACDQVNIVFDTVIMDEASKATPPELALPILYGKKAIIVGDHRQLPPMIDDEEIKDTLFSIGEKDLAKTLSRDEFKKSQFENLFTNVNISPSIKGTFNTQYRMHPAINNVIEQFYIEDGGLKCGLPLDEISHKSFEQSHSRFHGLQFKNLLKPETHVIWLDVNSPELKEGTSRVNHGEVRAIDQFLQVLKESNGLEEYNRWLTTQAEEENEVGIISFYGKQISHLDRMLRNKHNDLPVRLSTVDKFQGMERNIIIVSMVRSNKIASNSNQAIDIDLYGELGYPEQKSLGFAESPNRLNVALSRARRLLVIVGNKDHFCQKEIYKNVYQSIESSPNGKTIMAEELEKEILGYE